MRFCINPYQPRHCACKNCAFEASFLRAVDDWCDLVATIVDKDGAIYPAASTEDHSEAFRLIGETYGDEILREMARRGVR